MMLNGLSQKTQMVIISSQENKLGCINQRAKPSNSRFVFFYFILNNFPTLSMYDMKKGGNTFDM